ncbi:DNA polymerase-3 subunit epsilon [Bradyrhizobium sp. i1.15.2]|uniref:3'-5' exonuclease n=1 Tax=Bradyrhizobium sp. i1.15.2 TaxID=3156362 RepID=UPI003399C79B
MVDHRYEDCIRELEATGDFRVLRRAALGPIADRTSVQDKIAVIVDVETTGLDLERDEIIEIGMVAFSYGDDGRPKNVIGTFSGLQQPQRPVSSAITELTGISNDDVAGKIIDRKALEAFIQPSALVIAHNAAFDRPFCERLTDVFAEKSWACSMSEVNWRARGFEGSKLAYILGQFGRFHDGHRAMDDCIGLFNVLTSSFPHTESPVFLDLLSHARKPSIRISVVAPFEMRDTLRTRGYRWHPGSPGRPRSWWIEIEADAQEREFLALRSEGVRSENLISETLTALNRFKLMRPILQDHSK